MVSNRMIYRAMNSIVTPTNAKGTRFAVFSPEYGTTRTVIVTKTKTGATVFRSNGQWHEKTGRIDSYIIATKMAMGHPISN